jgi:predicted acyl esterase
MTRFSSLQATLILIASLCTSPTTAQEVTKPYASTKNEVELLWGVKVPLRDGVHLNATIYRPKRMDGPSPVIFILTPYVGDTAHDRAMYFARNGYVFALVD